MKYIEFESAWDQEQWSGFCDPMTYRVVAQTGLPPFLPQGLVEKFNRAVVAATGNNSVDAFCVQGFRVDGTSIDEHQYIVTFDKRNGQTYAGFIEHANYPGRTTEMPQEMQDAIKESGIDVPFHFDGLPTEPNGSLTSLEQQNLISGFDVALKKQSKSEGFNLYPTDTEEQTDKP